MKSEIFVNLPVKNLDRAVKFFTHLGFKFNPHFTDQNATCMIINEHAYAMLLVEPFFKSFITKEICDTKKSAEVIMAFSVESKSKVDEMINKAIQAGAIETPKLHKEEFEWMYQRDFQDLDGHLWEIFWMAPDKAQS